tara:strand:+ start:845 stop:1294 length:450 start_codon:yes stop_codon:yes gene_type:complete
LEIKHLKYLLDLKNLSKCFEINLDKGKINFNNLSKNYFFTITISKIQSIENFKIPFKKKSYLIIKLKNSKFSNFFDLFKFILSKRIKNKNFLIYYQNKKKKLVTNLIPDWPNIMLGKNFLVSFYYWIINFVNTLLNIKNFKYLIVEVVF